MKRLSLFVWLVFMSVAVSAQMKWNQTYQNYIDQYQDIAVQEMLRYNIPASITLAQGIFESGAGRSELCRKGNNHFGIKCHGWSGATVYHDDDESQECFRAYRTALESYEDHSKFLYESQRYRKLFQLSRTDYKGWARGLKACGYATNPQYANKLIELIELYKLHEYDKLSGKVRGHHSKVSPQGQSSLHSIKIYNKNYYLYARKGDTFKSIGEEVGISYRKLAKYNERDRRDKLSEGDIIYLKKKRTRADKAFKNHPHVVKPGESMYSISQMYGIRLKSLYKKNHLTPDYQIRVGDKLKVY
ncbi:MAG: glucosaminidase domain-containing protein [Prevotella sp.]|nr:glucosaminidase domain-containing protein [Prevotella sp.]